MNRGNVTWTAKRKYSIVFDNCIRDCTCYRIHFDSGVTLEYHIKTLSMMEVVNVGGALAILSEASKNLLEACYQADAREELSEMIDGSLLDAVRDALIKAAQTMSDELLNETQPRRE